ncbi:ankyrin repeat domain-containing protein [Erysipelothrix urinaevulpis]|uniref:ankyrin repeat domain-containing protein n=1 Tax=Erysipelothrix urinaevulpis TaxID=2683717 RepID=UPI001357DC7A|nr:ankyrin repeat domain-containing protein [Erysipelothrix urinaevulpis]
MDDVENIIEKNRDILSNEFTLSDDIPGGSILQFTIQNNKPKIARYLIDLGVDINQKVPGPLEGWTMPILHVAIQATMAQSRFPRRAADGPKNDGVLFNELLDLVDYMIKHGANIHQTDSYGNVAIMRAVLDALALDITITDEEMDEDIRSLFKVLIHNGADLDESTKTRESVNDMFRNNDIIKYF